MIRFFKLEWLPHLTTNSAVSLLENARDELFSLCEKRWALHFKKPFPCKYWSYGAMLWILILPLTSRAAWERIFPSLSLFLHLRNGDKALNVQRYGEAGSGQQASPSLCAWR